MIRPTILFTDVDDVLVLQRTVDFNKHAPELSDDICRRLLHAPALEVLSSLVAEGAYLVITSHWTRFLDQAGFQRLFAGGGHPAIGNALHAAWHAPRTPTGTRLDAIDTWLSKHHTQEQYCILDDTESGSSLQGSSHDREGRVVLCQPAIGLHAGHLGRIRSALGILPRGKT